jgi:DNA-binding response OmpR family regulator
MTSFDLKLSKDLESKLTQKLKDENITKEAYILKLLENDLDSRITFENGFYFNEYLGKFFNQDNDEIKFTRIEKELLLTLIENYGDIVPVEKLSLRAWKREEVSIFAFRNMIKNIRKKTYYTLIKNHSNLGYSINI